MVHAFAADEKSALHRALFPGEMPVAQRMAVDQINATMLLEHRMRSAWSDKKQPDYEPLYKYPGSPFDAQKKVTLVNPAASLGGYRRMTREEAIQWARERGIRI